MPEFHFQFQWCRSPFLVFAGWYTALMDCKLKALLKLGRISEEDFDCCGRNPESEGFYLHFPCLSPDWIQWDFLWAKNQICCRMPTTKLPLCKKRGWMYFSFSYRDKNCQIGLNACDVQAVAEESAAVIAANSNSQSWKGSISNSQMPARIVFSYDFRSF